MLDSQRRTSAGVPLLADAQNTLQDFDPTYSGFGSDQAGVSSTPPSVAPEPGPYSHLLPPLTLLALFCDYCTLTAIIPIVPLTLPDSIDNSYIFLLFSSKALFQLIANPFVGRLVDRKAKESDCCSVDPPMIFIASLLVLILSTLGFAYAVDLNAGEGDSKDPWFQ
jgi:MFS family permease